MFYAHFTCRTPHHLWTMPILFHSFHTWLGTHLRVFLFKCSWTGYSGQRHVVSCHRAPSLLHTPTYFHTLPRTLRARASGGGRDMSFVGPGYRTRAACHPISSARLTCIAVCSHTHTQRTYTHCGPHPTPTTYTLHRQNPHFRTRRLPAAPLPHTAPLPFHHRCVPSVDIGRAQLATAWCRARRDWDLRLVDTRGRRTAPRTARAPPCAAATPPAPLPPTSHTISWPRPAYHPNLLNLRACGRRLRAKNLPLPPPYADQQALASGTLTPAAAAVLPPRRRRALSPMPHTT